MEKSEEKFIRDNARTVGFKLCNEISIDGVIGGISRETIDKTVDDLAEMCEGVADYKPHAEFALQMAEEVVALRIVVSELLAGPRAEPNALIQKCQALHEELMRSGFYATGHKMHEVVQKIGFEYAGKIEQQGRKSSRKAKQGAKDEQ